ncbi:MAG: hypothetical protein FWD48_10830 [Oscillospiraceae bacterium]|nr:hypothetical protein [Oscillospiraceae bacterium]
MITSKKRKSSLPALIITLVLFAAIAVFVLAVLSRAAASSEEEALRAVEENIIRAVVSCYAYEGIYPDGVEYLEEHYKLVINRSKYLVFYDKIGDNLMPNIRVTRRVN